MKNRLLVLALIAITFTGCYTSFSPRDYEEESFGQMDNYYYDSSDVAINEDSSEFYYPEEELYYGDPLQGVTVINNYGPDWGWGYPSPYYSRIYTSYGCYDPFYDPFYDPYCSPYYPVHYPYGYGNIYVGVGYGSGYYNSPSSVRYRKNTSHWTSLRNNGGRAVVTRGRDVNRGRNLSNENNTRGDVGFIKGIDLDRDLKVTKLASSSGSSKRSGLRTAGITRVGDSRKKVKRTTDLERRRIPVKLKGNNVNRDPQEKRTQEVKRKPRVNNNNNSNSKRSKRVYSSNSDSRRSKSLKTSTRTYYKPSSGTSKSSNVSSSSRSQNTNSKGYSSSRNTSRSRSSGTSSSRSSVSRSSGNSSSRSSVSRSSGGSSSRSSGSRSSSSSRSTSGSSSRRR